MSKVISLLLSITLLVSLCGCGRSISLKEKLIVEGIAVDSQQGEFLVTVQVYSGSADNTSQKQYQMFQAAGTTVYEALQHIDENTGKQSFYADTRVIVFSYEVLKKGLWSNLDFFIRSSEMGSNVCLAITMGQAFEVLEIESEGTNMPSKVLSNALHYGKAEINQFSGELMTVGAKLAVPYTDLTMPIVEVTTKEQKKHPVIAGIMCFRNDFPCFAMNNRLEWAYNWLQDYDDDRAYVLHFEEEAYTLEFRQTNCNIKSDIVDGHPHFNIHLSTQCNITEVSSAETVTLDKLPLFKQTLEQDMEDVMLSALNIILLGQQCDVFEFGKILKKQHPNYFKALSSWQDEILRCTFSCTVESSILRAGQGNVQN